MSIACIGAQPPLCVAQQYAEMRPGEGREGALLLGILTVVVFAFGGTEIVAIAAAEDEHVGVMSTLAQVLLEPDQAEELRTTDDPSRVLEILTPTLEEETHT